MVLRASHIVHDGLRVLYVRKATPHPPPRQEEWSASRRRLVALNEADSPSDAALPAYGLRTGRRKAHEFAPLDSGGIIEFDWRGIYAQNVDWR